MKCLSYFQSLHKMHGSFRVKEFGSEENKVINYLLVQYSVCYVETSFL